MRTETRSGSTVSMTAADLAVVEPDRVPRFARHRTPRAACSRSWRGSAGARALVRSGRARIESRVTMRWPGPQGEWRSSPGGPSRRPRALPLVPPPSRSTRDAERLVVLMYAVWADCPRRAWRVASRSGVRAAARICEFDAVAGGAGGRASRREGQARRPRRRGCWARCASTRCARARRARPVARGLHPHDRGLGSIGPCAASGPARSMRDSAGPPSEFGPPQVHDHARPGAASSWAQLMRMQSIPAAVVVNQV